MKLLICTPEYPPNYSAGIGNVAYNVVERLKKMGVECTICSPNGDIKLGSSKMIEKSGIVGLFYYWQRVSKYFKENDFDAAWLHNPLFFKNNPFKKYLVTMHSTYHGLLLKGFKPEIYYRIASKLEKRFLNRLQEKYRFTGVSNEVCNELTGIGVSKERITYIPNGVDTELFTSSNIKKALRKKFGIPEDDLVILSLGRLTEAKQPFKLIEVFSVIEKKMKDAILVIAGKGELLEKTKELAKRKNLKNVTFLGYVDHEKEAPDLYACSDYFIISSKYEGGEPVLTVAEAMASGLPCVVSDIPNLRFIEGAKSGIVVDFTNIRKAAGEVTEYLKKDNSEHSKNAREYSTNNLDWEIIAESYLKELEKL